MKPAIWPVSNRAEGFDLASQPFGLTGGPSPLGSVVRISPRLEKKKRTHTTGMSTLFLWLGRRDSNPRMPGPKPGALPLGHALLTTP